MTTISRRAAAQMLGAGAVSLMAGRRATAQTGDPVRIAVLAPLSGFAAALGRDMAIGGQIAEDMINRNGGVLGRKVEVIARDDRGDANEAVAAVRELSGRGVSHFVGGPLTPTVLAAFGVLPSVNGSMIAIGTMGDAVTHEAFTRHGFRLSESAALRGRGLGKFAAQRYPEITSWAAIIGDNEAGVSQYRAFASGVNEFYPKLANKKAEVLEPLRVKYGASDFKNEVAKIMASPAEGLLIAHPDPVTMTQQARAFGWERKIKAFMDMGNDIQMANALGRRTPPGFWTTSHWMFAAYQNLPAGKALYEAYVEKTKDPRPSGFMGVTQMAVMTYAQAIAKAGKTDTDAVIAALESNMFDTAGGKRVFRKEDHQALGDFSAYQIVADDNDPKGWKVGEFFAQSNSDAALPPNPGKPVVYP
ncbi:MAG: ABC transporter substrate-binding protein [Rhizobiales bacterium]|mgnify:CR=1 FL=1|nr:ABC transporter substrate-binding protein [Hyphomicrobiales bacterium]